MVKCIYPNWPAPSNIRGFTSTRQGGVSLSPYNSLNLGSHVADNIAHVNENRRRLIIAENIPTTPFWLNQTHSIDVVDIGLDNNEQENKLLLNADASYTNKPKHVSVILTADCLPVLFCSTQGDEVAATHAGWRGLCNGILENTVKKFRCKPSDIIAWLGPAIGPQKFEVGQEVKDQFEAIDRQSSQAFTPIHAKERKYLADLYQLATLRLNSVGVKQVYGGNCCTYTQDELFYSYRREPQTGRMASIIWFE